MSRIEELRARREQLIKQARDIAETALDRDITAEEERKYSWLNKEITAVGFQLRDEQDLDIAGRDAMLKMGQAGNSAPQVKSNGEFGVPFDDGQSFMSLPDADPKMSLRDAGEGIREILLNGTYQEERVQSVGTGSEGGYLVPSPLSSPILTLATNQMQVRAAGATIVPMSSNTQKIGKLETRPTFSYRNEGSAFAESSATFDVLTLTSRSAAMYAKASVEVIADMPNFQTILVNTIADAAALEMDRVALLGTGVAPMPLGLAATPGINAVTLGSGAGLTLTDETAGHWQPYVAAKGRLTSKNYRNLAVVHAPRTGATLGGLRDTTKQPLMRPAYLDDVKILESGQVPVTETVGASTDCTSFYMGDWSNLICGIRSEMVLQVLREHFLVTEGRYAFAAWMRLDVQVARTAAFEIVKGIRP